MESAGPGCGLLRRGGPEVALYNVLGISSRWVEGELGVRMRLEDVGDLRNLIARPRRGAIGQDDNDQVPSVIAEETPQTVDTKPGAKLRSISVIVRA